MSPGFVQRWQSVSVIVDFSQITVAISEAEELTQRKSLTNWAGKVVWNFNTPKTQFKPIQQMFEDIEPSKVKTMTFDNGTEFFYHDMLKESMKRGEPERPPTIYRLANFFDDRQVTAAVPRLILLADGESVRSHN